MDVQECKVFFPVETTPEQADTLIARYGRGAKIDNFMQRRQIGCNEVTFAIVTLPVVVAARMVEDNIVSRIDVIAVSRDAKASGDCGGCPPSG